MRNALVMVIAVALSGCATTGPQWAAYGSDALQCAAPAAEDVITRGVGDLVARANGQPGGDWKALGVGLVATYSPALAICLVERAVARFVGAIGAPAALSPAGEAAAWLSAHRGEWLP